MAGTDEPTEPSGLVVSCRKQLTKKRCRQGFTKGAKYKPKQSR